MNNRVVHLSSTLTDIGNGFGSAGTGSLNVNDPHSLAVHGSVLFVADTFNNRIQEFTLPYGPVAATGAVGGGDQERGGDHRRKLLAAAGADRDGPAPSNPRQLGGVGTATLHLTAVVVEAALSPGTVGCRRGEPGPRAAQQLANSSGREHRVVPESSRRDAHQIPHLICVHLFYDGVVHHRRPRASPKGPCAG
jgi:hypothetical protein